MVGRARWAGFLGSCISVAAGAAAVPAAQGAEGGPAPFTEEAVPRGIDLTVQSGPTSGRGVALVDLDADGDPDLVALGRADDRVAVFENGGNGTFTDRTAATGLAPLSAGSASGVVAGDYDGDGLLDLYLSNYNAADRLVRNVGGLRFVDVTASAGLGDEGRGTGCAWADYDGDGHLDLFLSNVTYVANPSPNRLYRNLGDGTFAEAHVGIVGGQDQPTWQTVFFDYDADGDPDVYVSNDKGEGGGFEHNYMWRNDGGTFVDVTAETQTWAFMDSMGVGVGDFDGNGYSDLYCTNDGPDRLFLNQGSGPFLESSILAGTFFGFNGWAALFFDYDNDAHEELYVCNFDGPNQLFDHDGSWPCDELAQELQIADTAASYCAATADVDGDGDLDLVLSNFGTRLRLYINHAGEQRHWLKVRVGGSPPNTHAVGTWVELLAGGRTQRKQVLAGVGFKSSSTFDVHFGLDDATVVDQLVVTPQGGSPIVLTGLPADQTVLVNCTAAGVAAAPSPLDGLGGVELAADLAWSGTPGTYYRVYLGRSLPPPLVGSSTSPSFDPGVLAASSRYYWRVETVGCETVAGPVWTFRTREHEAAPVVPR